MYIHEVNISIQWSLLQNQIMARKHMHNIAGVPGCHSDYILNGGT
jgi:hypothetical protein